MRQPIIDPDKVNAWTESMRGSFAGSDVSMWLLVGIIVGVLIVVIAAAWWTNHHLPPSGMDDLDRLIKPKAASPPAAKDPRRAPVRR